MDSGLRAPQTAEEETWPPKCTMCGHNGFTHTHTHTRFGWTSVPFRALVAAGIPPDSCHLHRPGSVGCDGSSSAARVGRSAIAAVLAVIYLLSVVLAALSVASGLFQAAWKRSWQSLATLLELPSLSAGGNRSS